MVHIATPRLDAFGNALPESAQDVAHNLASLGHNDVLDSPQLLGTCLATAYYLGDPALVEAVTADAIVAELAPEVFADAQAAAVLMATNAVYYRFRHMVGKEAYSKKPARLRMHAMARPHSSKALYELMALALAALAGCELCIRAHEASARQHGLSEDHVHEAVRVAAILQGVVVARGLPTSSRPAM